MTDHREVWVKAADGLTLFARDYGPETSARMPALCLSGLTRNSRDFEVLAPALALERRVIAMDYRGRGRSAYAADGSSYRPDVELHDALTLLNHLAIPRVAVIGTSRGGIVSLLMAAHAPDRLAGVLFNDIGPVIETAGLVRISAYLGRTGTIATWAEAITAVKRINPGFPGLSDAMWRNFAGRIFNEAEGGLTLAYDARLADNFPSLEAIQSKPAVPLWEPFGGLAGKPVAVLRGENSDLLSAETVAGMAARHPGLIAASVANRGHVPFLDEPESKATIARWLEAVDR